MPNMNHIVREVNEPWNELERLRADNERLRKALRACVNGSRDWMDKAKEALNQTTQ